MTRLPVVHTECWVVTVLSLLTPEQVQQIRSPAYTEWLVEHQDVLF